MLGRPCVMQMVVRTMMMMMMCLRGGSGSAGNQRGRHGDGNSESTHDSSRVFGPRF
jgi:hypothetical protein